MTTSPAEATPHQGTVTANGTSAGNNTQTLLQERAASIGWYFIESYYDFYNKNIENIYKLYHPNALISHEAFPKSAGASSASVPVVEPVVVHQALGVEAIKARFQTDEELKRKDNRIVVISADIQVCLQDKILIVVTGEWSREGGLFFGFLQTFLLSPGRQENSLDLSNDILRWSSTTGPISSVTSSVSKSSATGSAAKPTTGSSEKKVEKAEVKTDKVVEKSTNLKATPAGSVASDAPAKSSTTGVSTPSSGATTASSSAPVASTVPSKVPVSGNGSTSTATTATTISSNSSTATPTTGTPVASANGTPSGSIGEASAPPAPVESSTNGSGSASTTATPNASTSTTSTATTPSNSSSTSGNTGSGGSLSWAANLASSTNKKSSSSPIETSVSMSTQTSSPTTTSSNLNTGSNINANTPLSTTSGSTNNIISGSSSLVSTHGGSLGHQLGNNSTSPPSSRYKKDEWFPIYIRGIRDPITEDILKKHLSAKFGPIKFLKVNIYIALCDFVDYESQQKALDAKETTVAGITIQLEIRESKNNNNGGYTKVGPKGPAKDKKLTDKKIKEKKNGKKK